MKLKLAIHRIHVEITSEMLQKCSSLDKKKKKKGNWKISMKEMKRIAEGFDCEKAPVNDKCRQVPGVVDFKPFKA